MATTFATPPGAPVEPGKSTNRAFVMWDGVDHSKTFSGLIVATDAGAISCAGLSTSGDLLCSGLTATTVPYLDASKILKSSAVTPTQLGYVAGVTSAIQTQMDLKAPLAGPTFTGTTTTAALTAVGAVILGLANNTTVVNLRSPSQGTVGAAGGASAVPATPTGYLEIAIQGTAYVIPYFLKA